MVAGIGLAAGVAIGSLWIAQRFEWALYDRMTAIALRQPVPPDDVVIVAIDEPSFSELGLQWPWPRRLHASLIDALAAAGARTIVFDLVFDTPSDGGNDEGLAGAMERAGNVVLASDRAETTDRRYSLQQWVDPIPVLAGSAASVGSATSIFDPDGVIRRSALATDGRPTLALAAAYRLPGLAIPQDLDRPRLIQFRGAPRQGVVTVSYYQAMQPGLLPADAFRGKTVFVGRSLSAAAALDEPDHVQTPVSIRTPAVELHANLFAMLATNAWINDPFETLPMLVVLSVVVGLVAAVIFYRLHPPAGLFTLLVAIGIAIAGSYFSLASRHTRLPVVAPIAAAAGVFVTTTAYRFMLGRRERLLIKRAFQHYVAPAIVEQMLADPSRLKLGGETYDITVMFTDLEGFTTIAEGLTASQLRDRLSSYFKAMMDELLAEPATLDKFIGDAIMVYFGCPIPDPNHPAQACRAALAMQRRLGALNASQHDTAPFRMRIGINTGTVVAGNMGTDTIFNFTVLGDCVNLASRLEGGNKEYGSSILVGEETWSRVKDQFEWRELDWIRVKGKTKPVAVYELLGEAGSGSAIKQQTASRFNEALAAYRAQKWSTADQILREVMASDPSDQAAPVFLKRCEFYARHPPPEGWDGVHVMTTK